MKSHLQSFMHYLTEDKGLSSSTLESYGRDISQFLDFAAERGIPSPDEIRRSHLLQYLAALRGAGRAAATVNRSTVSLRAFFIIC